MQFQKNYARAEYMDIDSSSTKQEEVISVADLNRYVAQVLGQQVPMLWVKGEISNLTIAASGHWYFSLKDDSAMVSSVMFRGRAASVGFRPQNGLEIEALGQVGLYEPRGTYQFIIEQMRQAGKGNLHEEFLRIKNKLIQEGLCDNHRKKSLPSFIKTVGIVTSLGAAALQDVLTAIRRRAPYINIIIYPSLVQGKEAPYALSHALMQAKQRQEVDVLLLVRGGGSIEDLWAFNDESLARLIADMPMPVVSGVGHETDFTIADFVADMRAPTPTAAAELVSVTTESWLSLLEGYRQRLSRGFAHRMQNFSIRVDRVSMRLVSPQQRLAQLQQKYHYLHKTLHQAIQQMLREKASDLSQEIRALQAASPAVEGYYQRVGHLTTRLNRMMPLVLQKKQAQLQAKKEALQAYNPRAILKRGYSITYNSQAHVVKEANTVQAGEKLRIELGNGQLDVVVLAEEN
ncbi:exodeoxyribonuclease VII large subunit [Pelistega suis]|uniref:exodeoxyribonuclease VII large subunit n=1 Tax=Pelistega suis TaxID=1631957 RepID=UPI00211BC75D|nr:exodeoxyribonuclease VII large subunit [Pelistega suis]MCQ9328890.1 exodeoxyribonuclease VII large subunit [Pelistega suis]